MFTQSAGASSSIVATLTNHIRRRSPNRTHARSQSETKLLTWIALLYAATSSIGGVAAALDWQQVKPMYLVSMYPGPFGMAMSQSPSSSSSSISSSMEQDAEMSASNLESRINGGGNGNSDEDVDVREPLVLNLETTPLLEKMLPEGAMAMDRIFGGDVGNPHCFPYQVGMLLQRPKGLYWCGGSLISEQHVLTAAHCVDMAKRALVFLGANEIKNAKEKGQVRLMVPSSNFHIYPTWNPKRLKDDIALIRLPHAVSFNDRIHPIQLPKRHYEYRNFKNKLAIASGWGRYATGVHAISNVLRYVQLQIIDGRTCKTNFPLSYRGTNICTSGRNSRSTCNGDSGGPLVLQRRQSKKRVLVGITSFGSIYGCDRGYPAAFTKVASYLDWISDETGVNSHQDTTEAIFFDQYMRDYGKPRQSRRLEQHHQEDQEEDDQPDELDVNTSSDEDLSEDISTRTHKRQRPRPRPRPKSEYEFYFL
ncbi:transmembrane protease serine 12 [Drosophila obscura]|uniref:transmembrane protease serine 12 n=1 Tax=Drosophila obscura TaxID=7282 RepID=UPI001BB11265|nr:transmembrane protease serine 12 [Drosophila obscura]